MLHNISNHQKLKHLLNEPCQEVDGVESIKPFIMHLTSSSDIWAFIGSNHCITAGRKNPDHALFPYYTQDKLIDMVGSCGSLSVIRYQDEIWIPFEDSLNPPTHIRRSVIKSISGTKIALSEYNDLLNLKIVVTWTSSKRFGILRNVQLINTGINVIRLSLIDGIQNILPPSVDEQFQNRFSNLADAYKYSERLEDQLAVYSLSSIPTDRAEPSESLSATTVWSAGVLVTKHYLSKDSIGKFVSNQPRESDSELRGRPGCYLIESELEIEPGSLQSWWIIADVDQSISAIENLHDWLGEADNPIRELEQSIDRNTTVLNTMVSQVDGFQKSHSIRASWRHYSNSLFNIMRGGTFLKGYEVPTDDYRKHVQRSNNAVYNKNIEWLQSLSSGISIKELKALTQTVDADLYRITNEYLPLTFSRRHGDPSRPWNRFNIDLIDEAGNQRYAYQGNWRDIFQNWEALLHSYPLFAKSVISRFLNATTWDGYNPYRISQNGIDWEKIEPEATWSNIGYWGDHQIIYLLKLLEFYQKVDPQGIAEELNHNDFVFAQVPYRIKSIEHIKQNAADSIEYDDVWSAEIDRATKALGSDGQLLHDPNGKIRYATFCEKLFIPLLTKVSNFVPGAGIWMNTQRPEWNDANNALAGYGCSVVTLGYMLRYTRFLKQLIDDSRIEAFSWHKDLVVFIHSLKKALDAPISPQDNYLRALLLNQLGEAGSLYRNLYYDKSISDQQVTIDASTLLEVLSGFENHMVATLQANLREDGLYHAYNTINIQDEDSVLLKRLPLMLEGQVSIMSSSLLSVSESLKLIKSLRQSELYREDQKSYLLYPDQAAKSVLDKGLVMRDNLKDCPQILKEIDAGKSPFISKSKNGNLRFKSNFRNLEVLKSYAEQLDKDSLYLSTLYNTYEETFNHAEFIGRSRSFFAYEGLGSIYWHMVSKLVLAVQEVVIKNENQKSADLDELVELFRELKEGLGVNKDPQSYGAFPTDAYSHTPAHAGAQQPGMTGQVKEDIIIRLAELGIRITDGTIQFNDTLLDRSELLDESDVFTYFDELGNTRSVELEPHSLAYTFCGLPIILQHSEIQDYPQMSIKFKENEVTKDLLSLTKSESKAIYDRNQEIQSITIKYPINPKV